MAFNQTEFMEWTISKTVKISIPYHILTETSLVLRFRYQDYSHSQVKGLNIDYFNTFSLLTILCCCSYFIFCFSSDFTLTWRDLEIINHQHLQKWKQKKKTETFVLLCVLFIKVVGLVLSFHYFKYWVLE